MNREASLKGSWTLPVVVMLLLHHQNGILQTEIYRKAKIIYQINATLLINAVHQINIVYQLLINRRINIIRQFTIIRGVNSQINGVRRIIVTRQIHIG
jgi:hypothetical protein